MFRCLKLLLSKILYISNSVDIFQILIQRNTSKIDSDIICLYWQDATAIIEKEYNNILQIHLLIKSLISSYLNATLKELQMDILSVAPFKCYSLGGYHRCFFDRKKINALIEVCLNILYL